MKYKFDSLNVTQNNPLGSLREQLTHITLMALVFFLIPLIVTSLTQIYNYGWQTYMIAQVVSYFVLVIMLIFRKSILYKVSASIIIIALYVIGIDLFISLGLSSGGGIYFVFASVLGALLFEGSVWIVFMLIGVITILAVAYSSITGVIPVTRLNFSEHNTYITTWISYISVYVSAACVIIFSIKAIYYVLTRKNKELLEKNTSLSETNEQLQSVITRKDALEKDKEAYLNKIINVVNGTVKIIAELVEEKDTYITGHQDRVAILSEAIAKELKINQDVIYGLIIAAKLHDIGKIYIPEEILNKPEKLDDEEFSTIKTHVEKGFKLINSIPFPWDIASIVRQHHERIDGTGYPFGLRDKDIRIEAKIISVADTVEAMISSRTYRKGKTLDEAIAEIVSKKGIYFEPSIVEACIKVLENKELANRISSH